MMKRMFCPKPWENVLIEINGDVYFCCYSHRPKGMIGSLQANNLAEIWESQQALDIRKTMMAGKIPFCCLDCELFQFNKKWVLDLRKVYLNSPVMKRLLGKSKALNWLKNYLRNVLYNIANLKK
jgi:radical SAM protein with 4Fe4S-binding SPASM domain